MQRSYFGRLQQWIRTGYRMPAQKIVLRPENHWKYVTYLTLIRSKSIVVYLGRRRTEKTHQQRVGRCESHGLNVLLESGTRSTHLRSCWRRTFWAHTVIKMMWCDGLTENAGRENDGPAKLQSMKLQDMKLADQCAGHEIAGRKNDGTICRTWNCKTGNCRTWKCWTWKCRTWKWRTKNDDRAWNGGGKVQFQQSW